MARAPRVTIYQAQDGWRWRITAGSRIIAESGEAYVSRRNAQRGLQSTAAAFAALSAQ